MPNAYTPFPVYLAHFLQITNSVPTPKWSPYYNIQGDIFVPLARIQEPFQAWYDSESNSSRIDYHHGRTKTYQLANKGSFGSSFKIVPASTRTEKKIYKCIEVNGSDRFQITPQLLLPDLTNYKLMSKTRESFAVTERWVSMIVEKDTIIKFAMTLYIKDYVAYPLHLRVAKYNSMFDSIYDSYIIDYKAYSPDKFDPTVFNVDDFKCQYFSGPDLDHNIIDVYIYNFNPIMEYTNGYGRHVDVAFKKYQRHYERGYIYGTKEHFIRTNYFRQNLRYIHSKNRAHLSYKLSVNRFADYSDEELKSMKGFVMTRSMPNYEDGFPYEKKNTNHLPRSLDLRKIGAVTPVKDQSICGSSWSFSTTGNIEGAYFVKYGELKNFSEQALIDCSWGFGNRGCHHGEHFRAYSWIKKYGLPTEEKYGPYIAQNGLCLEAGIPNKDRAMVSDFVDVHAYDEESLKIALVIKGPISVAISVASKSFYFYSSGIFDDQECRNEPWSLNHAMLLVGYDGSVDNAYWIVKNSWSTRWGEDGYVRIPRNHNICGVMTSPSFVVLKDSSE